PSMVGYDTVDIPSNAQGCVDIEALKKAVGDDTAGLMLTNPNTLGLFEKDILEITDIVHKAGGLIYYDGANLNAIMGIARPGDMGFDVVHYNIHKTLSTPHGGGGPGGGPVGCKKILTPFLPASALGEKVGEKSIGQVRSFYGNFLVAVRCLTYVLTLGKEGIPRAASQAVLNANYLMNQLKDTYQVAYDKTCMHEFVLTLVDMKKAYGITAIDIAKGLLDYGMHPPTMYFPLIMEEALMLEPTETESKATLDEAVDVFKKLAKLAKEDPEVLKQAPLSTYVRRLDEVKAARNPVLKYVFDAPEKDEK
ncbi:MAG: aminomethyl-transferring glycine dehydrogenase subunit GcvPB, partial [Clostridiales bacterium]|nr:aminomethyl-transferring glycine dehydrogenase subunit GcvPB [Clostridiales bacterium]